MTYRIQLDLRDARGRRAVGNLALEASPGRLLPRAEFTGARGWLTGYVVPVMSGALNGAITVDGEPVSLDAGAGYHDHNWGFWKDMSWRWGQVQYGDLSLLYGRIFPPREAADPERLPGFLGVVGPDGPLSYTTNVRIEETNDSQGRPRTITVTRTRKRSRPAPEVRRRVGSDATRRDRSRRGRYRTGHAGWPPGLLPASRHLHRDRTRCRPGHRIRSPRKRGNVQGQVELQPDPHRFPCRDLRTAAPEGEPLEPLVQWQPRLNGACRFLAARHFDAEAFEAQGARTLDQRIVRLRPEAIARLPRPAGGTQR